MLIVVSPDSPHPMYRQVADQVKEAIARGDVTAGERLPSIREMARDLNISVITVKRAYLDLEGEGYLRTRAGLGTFVADVDLGTLRDAKLGDMRKELGRMLDAGRRFGISPDDVARLLDELKETRDA